MKLDDIKKLGQKKYRERFGCFLLEGEHLVLELQRAAQRDAALLRSELYVTDAYVGWHGPLVTHRISERQMAQIADTATPQGIVAVVPLPIASAPVAGERAVYLHEVQDPGNLGTVLRSLAWFGGFRCLLGPGSVDPWNPKVVRASMGAIFHVPIEREVALADVPARYPRIAALDMSGEPLPAQTFGDFDCYLFGNEARGLPQAALDAMALQRFTISGSGVIESLNLAATVAICVYQLSQ